MLLGLTCSMQQELIHAEDNLVTFELLTEDVQDAQTHTLNKLSRL